MAWSSCLWKGHVGNKAASSCGGARRGALCDVRPAERNLIILRRGERRPGAQEAQVDRTHNLRIEKGDARSRDLRRNDAGYRTTFSRKGARGGTSCDFCSVERKLVKLRSGKRWPGAPRVRVTEPISVGKTTSATERPRFAELQREGRYATLASSRNEASRCMAPHKGVARYRALKSA